MRRRHKTSTELVLTIVVLGLALVSILLSAKDTSAVVAGSFPQKDELVVSSFRPFPVFLGQMQHDSVGSNLYVGLYGAAGECVYSNFYVTDYQTESDMRNNVNPLASAAFKHTFWLFREDGTALDNPFGAGPSIASPQHFALQIQPDEDFTKLHMGHWYAINGLDCGDQSRVLSLYGHGEQVFWVASDNKYQALDQFDHSYDQADMPVSPSASPSPSPSNPYVYINQIYKQSDGQTAWIYVRWTLLQKWSSDATGIYVSLDDNLPDNSISDRSLGLSLDQGNYMWKPVNGLCNSAGSDTYDYTTGQQYLTRFPSISGVNASDVSPSSTIRFTVFVRTLYDSSPCNMERKTAFPDPTDFHVEPAPTPPPTPIVISQD